MNKLVLVTMMAVTLSACAVEDPLGDVEQQAGGAGGAGGGVGSSGTFENQGRHVESEAADLLVGTKPETYLSTSNSGTKNTTTTPFTVNGSCLEATIGGTFRTCAALAFNNYVFAGSGGANVKIISSSTIATTPIAQTLTGYRLQVDSGAGYVDYCPSSHLAYPIAGEMYRAGVLDVSVPRITWACSEYTATGKDPLVIGNGVLGKALSWGFVPGANLLDVNGDPITSGQLMIAADHAGTADLCYNGHTHTIDGTRIRYSDLVSGNAVPEAFGPLEPSPTVTSAGIDPSVYYFEAAWTRSQVVLTGGGNYVDLGTPLCLSKLRWRSLPPGPHCGGKLKDPRVDPDGVYCEDWGTYADLARDGGVIVTASQYNDFAVTEWVDAGGDHWTTYRGADNGIHEASVPPATGFDTPVFLGTLLTNPGRDVWTASYGTAAVGTFVKLQSCQKLAAPGLDERLTTTLTLPVAGYGNCTDEGWIWSTPPSSTLLTTLGLQTIALYRYKQSGGTDYYTTTRASVAGYGNKTQLGWILAPKSLE